MRLMDFRYRADRLGSAVDGTSPLMVLLPDGERVEASGVRVLGTGADARLTVTTVRRVVKVQLPTYVPRAQPVPSLTAGDVVRSDRFVVLLACGHWTQAPGHVPPQPTGEPVWRCDTCRDDVPAARTDDQKPAILGSWDIDAGQRARAGQQPETD